MAFPQPIILSPLSPPPANTLMSCVTFNPKAGGGHGAASWPTFGFRLPFISVSEPASHRRVKEMNQLNIDFMYHFHLSDSQIMLHQWTFKTFAT